MSRNAKEAFARQATGNRMGRARDHVLVECLVDWDADTIFGIGGEDINGIIDALRIRHDARRLARDTTRQLI